ncbi:MAG: NTP transferase domain-containing protein [Acidimicrobiaceae bacterium]|nr:NTP transferase domain-containing protein [Acidimicrobiaceae bacterium]
MRGPTLVILAAGRARRYGGIKQLAPIGKHGEATIDLIASDAVAAGFEKFVIVINRETGPVIRDHIVSAWPSHIQVDFAFQDSLRGTVDAVLSAEEAVGHDTPFGISNADDIYGPDAFRQLGRFLIDETDNCLVGFRLENSLVGDLPVSRGTCRATDGRLVAIVERRNVHRVEERFVADDGLVPRDLDPHVLVSMNLWGFQPVVWPLLHRAMDEHDFELSAEVLLPTFAAEGIVRDHLTFRVLDTDSRCIGVTHAEDLDLAQSLMRDEIEQGQRPDRAFG